MDNNKTVDNLNFIKIYFRVFIYKIIVLKYSELSKKEVKNHRRRMKTRLGTRSGQKTLKKSPNSTRTRKCIRSHRANSALLSAKRHSKRAEFPWCGLWPNGLRVIIMHTFFDLFAKGCARIQILIVRTYFLESSNLYK